MFCPSMQPPSRRASRMASARLASITASVAGFLASVPSRDRTLLLRQFRECLLQITLIDIFRRLCQRLFLAGNFGDDLDHRAHAFEIQIGVAVPDTVFYTVIPGKA